MRKLALAAAVLAALSFGPAMADTVTATIVSIDTENHTITLNDNTQMIVAKEVDLTAVQPGTRVVITTYVDEDGHTAASAIDPAK